MDCFFFNDTATTEIYTLSLHDALPIWVLVCLAAGRLGVSVIVHLGRDGGSRQRGRSRRSALLLLAWPQRRHDPRDRKSTRLNSSHANISYAVFCLKKKKITSPSPPLLY